MTGDPVGSFQKKQSVADVRQQRQLTGALNRDGELSLMSGAGAGDSAGQNLSSFRDEATELLSIFVIDELRLLDTESANLFAALSVHGAAAPVIFLLESHLGILL